MAPERILGDEYGIHSDVWSLGLSLVEMATGGFPYPLNPEAKRETMPPIELLHCIVNEEPPQLSRQQHSELMVDFISKCLKRPPKERLLPDQLVHHHLITTNDTE